MLLRVTEKEVEPFETINGVFPIGKMPKASENENFPSKIGDIELEIECDFQKGLEIARKKKHALERETMQRPKLQAARLDVQTNHEARMPHSTEPPKENYKNPFNIDQLAAQEQYPGPNREMPRKTAEDYDRTVDQLINGGIELRQRMMMAEKNKDLDISSAIEEMLQNSSDVSGIFTVKPSVPILDNTNDWMRPTNVNQTPKSKEAELESLKLQMDFPEYINQQPSRVLPQANISFQNLPPSIGHQDVRRHKLTIKNFKASNSLLQKKLTGRDIYLEVEYPAINQQNAWAPSIKSSENYRFVAYEDRKSEIFVFNQEIDSELDLHKIGMQNLSKATMVFSVRLKSATAGQGPALQDPVVSKGELSFEQILMSPNFELSIRLPMKIYVTSDPTRVKKVSVNSNTMPNYEVISGEAGILDIFTKLYGNAENSNKQTPPIAQTQQGYNTATFLDAGKVTLGSLSNTQRLTVDQSTVCLFLQVKDAKCVPPDSSGRTNRNLFVEHKIYGTTENIRSQVCWNDNTPIIDHRVTIPLNQNSIEMMKVVPLIISVWDKSLSRNQPQDELVGVCKIGLQSGYTLIGQMSPESLHAFMEKQGTNMIEIFDQYVHIKGLAMNDEKGMLGVTVWLGNLKQIKFYNESNQTLTPSVLASKVPKRQPSFTSDAPTNEIINETASDKEEDFILDISEDSERQEKPSKHKDKNKKNKDKEKKDKDGKKDKPKKEKEKKKDKSKEKKKKEPSEDEISKEQEESEDNEEENYDHYRDQSEPSRPYSNPKDKQRDHSQYDQPKKPPKGDQSRKDFGNQNNNELNTKIPVFPRDNSKEQSRGSSANGKNSPQQDQYSNPRNNPSRRNDPSMHGGNSRYSPEPENSRGQSNMSGNNLPDFDKKRGSGNSQTQQDLHRNLKEDSWTQGKKANSIQDIENQMRNLAGAQKRLHQEISALNSPQPQNESFIHKRKPDNQGEDHQDKHHYQKQSNKLDLDIHDMRSQESADEESDDREEGMELTYRGKQSNQNTKPVIPFIGSSNNMSHNGDRSKKNLPPGKFSQGGSDGSPAQELKWSGNHFNYPKNPSHGSKKNPDSTPNMPSIMSPMNKPLPDNLENESEVNSEHMGSVGETYSKPSFSKVNASFKPRSSRLEQTKNLKVAAKINQSSRMDEIYSPTHSGKRSKLNFSQKGDKTDLSITNHFRDTKSNLLPERKSRLLININDGDDQSNKSSFRMDKTPTKDGRNMFEFPNQTEPLTGRLRDHKKGIIEASSSRKRAEIPQFETLLSDDFFSDDLIMSFTIILEYLRRHIFMDETLSEKLDILYLGQFQQKLAERINFEDLEYLMQSYNVYITRSELTSLFNFLLEDNAGEISLGEIHDSLVSFLQIYETINYEFYEGFKEMHKKIKEKSSLEDFKDFVIDNSEKFHIRNEYFEDYIKNFLSVSNPIITQTVFMCGDFIYFDNTYIFNILNYLLFIEHYESKELSFEYINSLHHYQKFRPLIEVKFLYLLYEAYGITSPDRESLVAAVSSRFEAVASSYGSLLNFRQFRMLIMDLGVTGISVWETMLLFRQALCISTAEAYINLNRSNVVSLADSRKFMDSVMQDKRGNNLNLLPDSQIGQSLLQDKKNNRGPVQGEKYVYTYELTITGIEELQLSRCDYCDLTIMYQFPGEEDPIESQIFTYEPDLHGRVYLPRI